LNSTTIMCTVPQTSIAKPNTNNTVSLSISIDGITFSNTVNFTYDYIPIVPSSSKHTHSSSMTYPFSSVFYPSSHISSTLHYSSSTRIYSSNNQVGIIVGSVIGASVILGLIVFLSYRGFRASRRKSTLSTMGRFDDY